MDRKEFLERLEALLTDLPEDDRRDALDYYQGYLDEAGENTAKVLEELGSPEELADFLGKDKEHRLNLKDVSAIWEKDGGARKGMKGRKLFVLNQCPKEEATTLLAHFKDKREIYLCEKEERP